MDSSPRVVMLFLDGVGIGKNNHQINPFFAAKMTTFRSLLGGTVPYHSHSQFSTSTVSLSPINATLGVEGLPQSGTGQTSLLTGVNAAKIIGKHFGPYPYSTLKPIIEEQNIFKRLSDAGKNVFYANAFPPKYFEYIESKKARTPAIAYSWLSAGFQLNTHISLKKGEAISADMTGERWNALGFPPVKTISPYEAGKRLAGFLNEYHFVLYEYYFTDHAGHSQSMNAAVEVLDRIDLMLKGIIEDFDFNKNIFVLTSDHGNLEDLSTKSHTRNPVPFFLLGKRHRELGGMVKSLTDVTPALINFLT